MLALKFWRTMFAQKLWRTIFAQKCWRNLFAQKLWRNMFAQHREMDAASKARIPFPFYRESISLFQRHPDGGKDEELWKDFFQKKKIDAMHRLPEAMKLRVTVKYPPPQMINVL